jgi:RNA polymerase sigma-70 factor (family 1)
MNELSEKQIFIRIQEGDERAFAILFDRYKSRLFRHIYQRTSSVYETEEIVQNIFISLWKNRDSIVIEESAWPYLMGAARNSVLYFFVKNAKNQVIESLTEIQEPLDHAQEDHLVAQELETFIDDVINKMPVTMKRSFELSRKENLSVKEIAEKMKLSEQTIKNNLTLALQRLRSRLNARHMLPVLLSIQSLSCQMNILLTI